MRAALTLVLSINVWIAGFCWSTVLNTELIVSSVLPVYLFITSHLMQCSNESSELHPSLQFRLFLFMEVKHILKLFTVFALALKRVDDSSNVRVGECKYDWVLKSGYMMVFIFVWVN